MVPGGPLTGAEIIPFVRAGVVQNFITTAAAIAGLAGGGAGGISLVKLNGTTSYSLSDGVVDGEIVAVFDNLGRAPGQTVTGNLNVGPSVQFSQAGQLILFFWDGSTWNVPSWVGLLNG